MRRWALPILVFGLAALAAAATMTVDYREKLAAWLSLSEIGLPAGLALDEPGREADRPPGVSKERTDPTPSSFPAHDAEP